MTAKKKLLPAPAEMHSPPHPGKVLWELYLKPLDIKIKEAAERLDIDRKTLSRIINERAPIPLAI